MCILTGITESIEFSFIFMAPMFIWDASILAESAYLAAHILNITVGLT